MLPYTVGRFKFKPSYKEGKLSKRSDYRQMFRRKVKFIAIKFADEIVKKIRERGGITIPPGCVTGEDFEEWIRREEIFVNPLYTASIVRKPRSKKKFSDDR